MVTAVDISEVGAGIGIYYIAIQELVAYGLHWVISFLSPILPAVAVPLLIHLGRRWMDEKFEEKSNHEEHLASAGVRPMLEDLGDPQLNSADGYMTRVLESGGEIDHARFQPSEIGEIGERLRGWVLDHDEELRSRLETLEDVTERLGQEHREIAEQIGGGLLDNTELTLVNKGNGLNYGEANGLLLGHLVLDEVVRGNDEISQADLEMDSTPHATDERRDAILVRSRGKWVALTGRGEIQQIRSNLDDPLNGLDPEDLRTRIQDRTADVLEARNRVLERLQELETMGRVPGSCPQCSVLPDVVG